MSSVQMFAIRLHRVRANVLKMVVLVKTAAASTLAAIEAISEVNWPEPVAKCRFTSATASVVAAPTVRTDSSRRVSRLVLCFIRKVRM